ncbi:MAG TPA: hypothetical protein VLB27_03095, partial [candidate division Zixibacteria bacterium]|nr:hypothetical protein [candidate division Zixibacteria bacterium]
AQKGAVVSAAGETAAQSAGKPAGDGVDTVSVGRARLFGDAVYRMSEIKKKAAERLAAQAAKAGEFESLTETHGDLEREDLIELAKLRLQTGFYQRADVIDEIARRISDKL